MDLPERSTITEEELERIACAMIQYKDLDGKYLAWGHDIIQSMIKQYKETGRVCLDVVKPE